MKIIKINVVKSIFNTGIHHTDFDKHELSIDLYIRPYMQGLCLSYSFF